MWMKILEIDLTAGEHKVIEDEDLFHMAMGGTAVATHLMERYCDPQADPLGADNVIVLATGPFSNILPVATKTVAMFKSPHTGELGESHAGGRLAMSMYNAGFSAIVIKGAATEPLLLDIDEDTVTFLPAGSIWGYSTTATDRVLRSGRMGQRGKRSIMRIGPAGERMSTYACATVDTQRHFGRLGLGAVMGSKNLKALMIGGGRYLPQPDRKRFRALYDTVYESVVKSGEMRKYHDLGTAVNIRNLNHLQGLPTRNFSQSWFESAEKISGEVFGDTYLANQIACAHCPCGCIHLAALREQFHEEHGFKTAQVSYDFELIYALGSNLSIDDPRAILRLLHKVEKEGWDAMSLGVTLSWATDAFLGGYIGTEETGGLVLRFGDADTYLEILNRMGEGTPGFFSNLERGAQVCGELYDCRHLAMTFGKNEAAGYMTGPNAFTDFIVGVRHSHLDCAGYALDQAMVKMEISVEDQVKKMADEAKFRMLLNSLVICLFARNVYTKDIISEGLNLLWRECTTDELETFNADILRRKYEFKLKCGWQPTDLELPGKLTEVITGAGRVTQEDIDIRADIYWREVGIPADCHVE
ncbi:MAG: aldehyde:ferredoxin oxidoreductase [bacterium]|nr:aldehyde:ferredoxin oxidoreductase [bacterium]